MPRGSIDTFSGLPCPGPPVWLKAFCAHRNEIDIELTERMAVAREAVTTIKNLPRTRSVLDTGLQRIVSIVPRSFSPAVRSIAGYIAPVRHRMMMKYGMNPPKVLPPTFSG